MSLFKPVVIGGVEFHIHRSKPFKFVFFSLTVSLSLILRHRIGFYTPFLCALSLHTLLFQGSPAALVLSLLYLEAVSYISCSQLFPIIEPVFNSFATCSPTLFLLCLLLYPAHTFGHNSCMLGPPSRPAAAVFVTCTFFSRLV